MNKAQYRQVRELLSNSSNWTKGALARDQSGTVYLSATHPSATCWCLLGACMKILNPPFEGDVSLSNFTEVFKAAGFRYCTSPSVVNDQIGWNAVLEILDLAIKNAPA